jgi:hypothetical protein
MGWWKNGCFEKWRQESGMEKETKPILKMLNYEC